MLLDILKKLEYFKNWYGKSEQLDVTNLKMKMWSWLTFGNGIRNLNGKYVYTYVYRVVQLKIQLRYWLF